MAAATLPPRNKLELQPFKVAVPDSELADLKTLIRQARLPPATYENQRTPTPGQFWGPNQKWMDAAISRWTDGFSWRESEKRLNTYPQWTTKVGPVDGHTSTIHFVGLFSARPDATAVLCMHGWPATYAELLDFAGETYRRGENGEGPAVHLVVPSLPGFAFSSPAPLDREFGPHEVGRVMDALMKGLGFGEEFGGYLAHGGDLGGLTGRIMAAELPACKGLHVNFWFGEEGSIEGLDEFETKGLEGRKAFRSTALSYFHVNALRPSMIGYTLASNPVALLSWLGQFYMAYTSISMDQALENITLWWFTRCFATSVYNYRHLASDPAGTTPFVKAKPVGFSSFAREVIFTPKSWAETYVERLVYYKRHDKGGHFAALEQPKLMAEDLLEFVDVYLKDVGRGSDTKL